MTDLQGMEEAIKEARKGIREGQTPFGACVVLQGKIIARNHNKVWKNKDITAHAEMQALRSACRKTKKIHMKNAVIYSTCEPCPMCFSACHWAGIKKIVYGAGINDAAEYGFRELEISNQKMKRLGKSEIELVAGVLKKECRALFAEWEESGKSRTY